MGLGRSLASGFTWSLTRGLTGGVGADLYANSAEEVEAIFLANGYTDYISTWDSVWAALGYANASLANAALYGSPGILKQDIIDNLPVAGLVFSELDGKTPSGSASTVILDASGSTEGALLLAAIVLRSSDVATPPIATPSGWTLVDWEDGLNVSTSPATFVYSRVAAASETTHTWTYEGASYDAASLIQVAGANTVDASNNANSSTLPAITLSQQGAFVSFAGQAEIPSTTMTPPSGYTQLSDRTGGGRTGLCVAYKESGATTSNGTDTYTGAENNVHLAIY